MSPTNMTTDKTISITEAARRLNVSERTVYRMLKSGKLTRHYVSDSVRILSDEVDALRSNIGSNPQNSVSNMSDTMPDSLRQQLAEKDAQIAQLLARQRELSQMLERLQEQVYELTRFVLSQAQKPPSRGFEWAFWRRHRRTHTDHPEEIG